MSFVASIDGRVYFGPVELAAEVEDYPPLEILRGEPEPECDGARVLRDRWQCARHSRECTGCSVPINAGEEYRSRAYVVAGEFYSEGHCVGCADPREAARRAG